MSQGSELRKWRGAKGLTQRALAELLGVHPQYISDIERGKRRPGMAVAMRIRAVSDGKVSLDALAGPAAAVRRVA